MTLIPLVRYFIINLSNMNDLQKRKVLSINDSSLHCLSNLYNPQTNPQGFVSFGFANNGTVINQTLSYLPKYFTSSDFNYQLFRGPAFINKLAITNTLYNIQQTIVLNNLLSIIDTLAYFRKISFQGKLQYFEQVVDYANSQIVQFADSECHFVLYPQSQKIKEWIQSKNLKMTVIVVQKKQEIVYSQNKNIYYTYQISFKEGYKCGVCHSKNSQTLTQLQNIYLFHSLSTIISSTVQALETNYQINAPLQKQFMNRPSKHLNFMQPFHQMIIRDSQYNPSEDHLFFCLGATACLNVWSYCLFQKGNLVGIDSPFYYFLKIDFQKSGLILSFRDMFSGTLMERIQKSQADGQLGYIIINPHNPTGKVFSNQEIEQICKWAIHHPHYHILINEIYLNSVYSKQTSIKSAVSYADIYPNITVIRGFAKDYGVCGFKVGFIISCNPIIIKKINKWKEIISPQKYVLKFISRLLQETEYGQKIYRVSQIGLNASTDYACKLLSKNNIKFLRPEAAVFIMIDLSKYLEQHPEETQQSIWCRLFYDHRVNLGRGLVFSMSKPGFYRMSHVTSQYNLEQGIKRISNFMMNSPIFSNSQ